MLKKIILTIIIIAGISLSIVNSQAQPPDKKRYISLAPSTTEILFALGLEDQILGVSQFCDYPYPATLKEKVGTLDEPDIEKIILLKPDIIFCAGVEQATAVVKLKQLNMQVCISEPNTVEELLSSINEIGRLTGRELAAETLTENMRRKMQEIAFETKFKPYKPKVYLEIYSSPLMTVGKNSILAQLVNMAGGINISDDITTPYSIITSEEIISRNPDCIILTYMDRAKPAKLVGRRLGWSDISAVKNNRIYNDIDSGLLIRSGPRIVEGLSEIKKRLHPKK